MFPSSVGVDQDTGADTLQIIQDPQYRRLKSIVDMKTACKLYRTERFVNFKDAM